MTALVNYRACFLFRGNGTDPGIPGIPIHVDLRYDPTDPYAVTATFTDSLDDPIVWHLSREILTAGLDAPAGVGDVVVAPTPARLGYVEVLLRGDNGPACFTVLASNLRDFLARTYDLVPAGREMDHIDVDAALMALLGDAS